MTDELPNLRPCPFCGGPATLHPRAPGWVVECRYYDLENCMADRHGECNNSGTDLVKEGTEWVKFINAKTAITYPSW